MISTQDRRDAVTLIDEALKNGARLFRACAELGLCPRTYRRWTVLDGAVKADGRPVADRPLAANALSEDERQKLIVLRALDRTGGNVTQAAQLAKRNRTEFYKLLQRHMLEPAMFKESKN